MIFTPDRLADAVAAIERGEPVNWGKIHQLQTLDLVRAGRQFVEEACRDHEASDAAMNELSQKWLEILEPNDG